MQQVNNLNFPEYMFAHLLLNTTEDKFRKQKQHKMKELNIRSYPVNDFGFEKGTVCTKRNANITKYLIT